MNAAFPQVQNGSFDIRNLSVHLELDPSAVKGDLRPPDIDHHRKLPADLLDDRLPDAFLRECQVKSHLGHAAPPAMAGMIDTSSPGLIFVSRPSRKRMSSSLT